MTKQGIPERQLHYFKKTASQLENKWGELSPDLENKMCDGYPFSQSFDELLADIYEWVRRVTRPVCRRCGLNQNDTQPEDQQEWEADYIKENGICSACVNELEENVPDEPWACCILCKKLYVIGESGNELGFCCDCQNKPLFPFDLDAYYRDYEAGKVVFKGFETMSRGLLKKYRYPDGFWYDALFRVEYVRNVLYEIFGLDDELVEHLNQAQYSLQLLQENLETIWNEAEEITTDLRDMTDEELLECRQSMLERAEKIMQGLDQEIPANQGGS